MNLFEKSYEIDFENLNKINIIIGKQNFSDGEFNLCVDYYEKIGLTVYKDDFKYEFIIFLIENCENILILGPGFLTDEKQEKLRNKPVFDRHTWVDDFNQNLIYYNDPTRYEFKDLKGGWGIGNEKVWHLKNIAEIIKLLSKKIISYENLEIVPFSNLFFYGSSMGGFMALVLSILIKNTTSIADIPQFNLFDWIYWDKLKQSCFNDRPNEYIFENFRHRLILSHLIEKEKYFPNTYIVLDCSYEKDFEKQFKDFLCELNRMPYSYNNNMNKIKLRIEGKNKGHYVLNRKETVNLIKNVIKLENELNYDKIKFYKFKVLKDLGYDIYSYNHLEEIDVCINKYLNKDFDYYSLKTTVKNIIINNEDLPSYTPFVKENDEEKRKILEKIINKDLQKYFTLRIDLKNRGTEKNNLSLLFVSDINVEVLTPSWLNNIEGNGLILKSHNLNMHFKIKCINDGQLVLYLRGIDFLKDANKKRIPIYIDVTCLKIDEKVIISKSRPICHDKPYKYELNIKNGQIIDFDISWRPLTNTTNTNLLL